MKRRRVMRERIGSGLVVVGAAVGIGAALAACTMDYGEFSFNGTGTGTGATTTTTSQGGTGLTPTGGGGTGATTTTTSQGGSGLTATGGGGAGGGPTGGSGGTGLTGGGGGGACDFTADNDCAGAEELNSVSGDTGSDSRQASGIGSHWLAVEVTENYNQAADLSYTVELTNPAGAQYDLYVYESAIDANAQDCDATPTQGAGNPLSVTNQWSDPSGGPNNDGRWLAIEVRYVSGDACEAGDEWTVTVNGHTQ